MVSVRHEISQELMYVLTVEGDEIQLAFLERRAWIVRLDPLPGVDERAEHIDGGEEQGSGRVNSKMESQDCMAGRSKLKRSPIPNFFRRVGYCLSLTSALRSTAIGRLVKNMMGFSDSGFMF